MAAAVSSKENRSRGKNLKKVPGQPAATAGKRASGPPQRSSRSAVTAAPPCDLTLKILEGTVEGVVIAEMKSNKIRYVNGSSCRMFGFERKEFLSLTIDHIHPAEYWENVQAAFASMQRGEIKMATSVPCRRKNGSTFWADISSARVTIDGTPCLVGFFSDTTDKKAARDSNAEAQALLASVFNAVPDILGIQDMQHGMVRYNEAGYRFLQTDTDGIRGKRCYELIGRKQPCVQCATSETYRTQKPAQLEKFVDSLGIWLDVRSYPIFDPEGNLRGIVEHLRDITRQKHAEAELVRTEKLASLAILAGGIAHDFNNLLGGIYGNLEMARTASLNPEASAFLDASLKTMNRAKGLTQQLLTFAKGGAPIRKAAGLDGFLNETVNFALSGSRLSCAIDIEAGLWACEYDASQLGQVVDNILINAQQAMPMGGAIEVTARNVMVGANESTALAAGRYVRISFRDHGVGIPGDLLEKIFDPFFTTKQQGSGLGLATSFSIIKQHGGTIAVESELGKGSVFTVYLPACAAPAESEHPAAAEPACQAGRILVMDDEEILRETISAMLQHHGYETTLAANGAEALRLFAASAESGAPFAAVIVDLTVPGGMGGREVVAEIRKRDKDIPVFVASGYTDDPILAQPQEYGFTASITKPFTRKDLIAIICNYL